MVPSLENVFKHDGSTHLIRITKEVWLPFKAVKQGCFPTGCVTAGIGEEQKPVLQ